MGLTVDELSILLTLKDGTGKGVKSAQASLDSLGGSLKSLGAPLLAVGAGFAAVGAASINMAMDAVESENLFEVAMGGMADSARDWSEELRTNLGLNAFEVRKSVSTFNQMLSSMGLTETAAFDMSKGLTQLSFDMASFFNLAPDIAFQKLQAGITGEVEPLKRLGIIVNETTIKNTALDHGLIQLGDTMTEQQKIQARYIAIMEQTANAQGDLARTMDSPTNRLRILKEQVKEVGIEIGISLLPAFNILLDTVQPIVEALSGMSDEQRRMVAIAILGGTAVGALGLAMVSLGIALQAVAPLIAAFGVITSAGIIGPMLALVAVVGTGVLALQLLSLHYEQSIGDTITDVTDGALLMFENLLVGLDTMVVGTQALLITFATLFQVSFEKILILELKWLDFLAINMAKGMNGMIDVVEDGINKIISAWNAMAGIIGFDPADKVSIARVGEEGLFGDQIDAAQNRIDTILSDQDAALTRLAEGGNLLQDFFDLSGISDLAGDMKDKVTGALSQLLPEIGDLSIQMPDISGVDLGGIPQISPETLPTTEVPENVTVSIGTINNIIKPQTVDESNIEKLMKKMDRMTLDQITSETGFHVGGGV